MWLLLQKAVRRLNGKDSLWTFLLGVLCGQFEYCGCFPFAGSVCTSCMLTGHGSISAFAGAAVGILLRGGYLQLIPLVLCAGANAAVRIKREPKAAERILIMCVCTFASVLFLRITLTGCVTALLMCVTALAALLILTNGMRTLGRCISRRRIAADSELIYVSLLVGFCILCASSVGIYGVRVSHIAAAFTVLVCSHVTTPYGLYTALLAGAGAGFDVSGYDGIVPCILSVCTVLCSLVKKRGRFAGAAVFCAVSLIAGFLQGWSMSIIETVTAVSLFLCVPQKAVDAVCSFFERPKRKKSDTLRQRVDDIKRATEALSSAIDEGVLAGDGNLAIRQLGAMPSVLERAFDVTDKDRTLAAEIGTCAVPKAGCTHTGDSIASGEVEKTFIAAVSDGMGSGLIAHNESTKTLNCFFEMQKAGFGLADSIDCVNRRLLSREDGDIYATLDALIVDLCAGTATSVKAGAPPSFLVRDGKVHTMSGESLPLGIVESVMPSVKTVRTFPGDVFILLTDGAGDALGSELIAAVTEKAALYKSAQDIARELLDEAVAHSSDDDMSVVCIKVRKK